ncbi:uncharacterized protein LOC128216099 [Mya arenaria]|uniref:uncharacterized protein LOC128216099 n=1 Tax=Mya arenaria TaxID=6604 RepID=UPI0022DFBFBB|nr:uncharacterized protein LOC128216099 [Mya arenaria]
MGPVKDSDLLKSVRDNNRTKLLKYLSPEKGLGSLSKVGVKDDQSFPGGRLRLKLNHVNINCREEKTGYTPLILAVLNGSKEFVDDILFHSADVDVQDIKGNTALHMAVFGGKMEIIDLLLQNRAEVNVQNSDGNTPLHIASQIEGDRVHMLLKLLTKGADHTIMNRDHKEALDLAIMFKRTDAVSILLDHDHGLEDSKRTTTEPNTQAMLEASIRGYKEGMELLLDYGYDPNTLDKEMDSTALQEAVRYNRLQVIETLLKYGAKNGCEKQQKTAETVLAGLPDSRANPIKALFEEYKKSGATQVPRFLKTLSRGMSLQGVKDYPILPNDPSWTQNSPDYCNSCTPNGPNTNILDDDPCSCWLAADFHQAWCVLDLRYDHTLTGITVYGWDSPQMVRTFELQKGSTLNGPWSTVVPCTCIKSGPTTLSSPGDPQTFTDFTARSRYWRILLLDNFGGKCICFQGIKLYGADNRIRKLLEENSMENYADDIIALGYNTYKKFLLISDEAIQEVVSDFSDKEIILKSLERDRPKEFHPSSLSWDITPLTSVRQGVVIPDFGIKSLPGVKTQIKLIADRGVSIKGKSVVTLLSNSETEPSKATFSGIVIDTPGSHILKVQCVDYPRVSLSTPQPIEIKPKAGLRDSVALAFDDMEAMLNDLSASLDPVQE